MGAAMSADSLALNSPGPGPGPGMRPSARRRRRLMEQRAKRRQLVRRIGVLALAVAIPTAAVQGGWGGLRQAMGLEDIRAEPELMPFETPGESFPGSAFYYLEDLPPADFALADLRGSTRGGEGVELAASQAVGDAAKAFRSTGSGLDKARALQCLSMAVYYEAASESYDGQRAVAQVVLNRVAHPTYPGSVCGVVFQGSERSTGCQFTFTCDGSLRRKPSRAGYARAQSVALSALAGEVFAPVGLATHYHTDYVNPYWAASLDYIGAIGAHRFYRWKGRAGTSSAFTDGYSGAEPGAMARASADEDIAPTAVAAAPGPVAPTPPSNRAIAAAPQQQEPVGAKPDKPPIGPPQSGDVREKYRSSGQWLREPGAPKKD